MSVPTPTSSSADDLSRRRRWTIAGLLWLYGISITIFLFSIWGRAVVTDTGLLSAAASRAANSELVSSRVETWFDRVLAREGLGEGSGTVSELIVAVPEVRMATADLVGELVRAVAETADGPVVIDVASAYRPAVPAVAAALARAGVPVGQEQVEAVVAELDPLVIEPEPDQPPPVGPRSNAARSLTVATLVALGSMVASGGGAVTASRERRTMFRSLLNRLAVSGFTYFVFFQISAWVLDPRGGRATIRGSAAEIVGSKLWIPLAVGAVAGVAGWMVRHRHRHGQPPGASRPAADE